MTRVGIVVVGHGSRARGANGELEHLVAQLAARRPDTPVAHGYVELATPTLDEAIDCVLDRADRAVLAPAFLFAARHIKADLPLAAARAQQRHPGARVVSARPLGVHTELAGLIVDRVRAAARDIDDTTAVVVVGRGSSDPDANADLCKLVRLAGEALGAGWTVPAYVGIAEPRVGRALELVARARPRRIVVVPYMLFGGRLVDRVTAQVKTFAAAQPWIRAVVTGHLGPDPRVLAALDTRLEDALTGAAPLPCDTCAYRAPVADVAGIDGLRALLWSVRHTATHSQAMPHEHAHRPMAKHVLVCGNVDCAARGSIGLISALRAALRRAGRHRDIRVTRTSCLGRCGEGPTVAVYPDGVWYRGVAAADALELVRDHLVGDRLIGRLVDNIMQ